MLTIKDKIGYGLGDAASNIIFQVAAAFMTFFYTDIYGISGTAAAAIILTVRIFDAITDPIMGGIADRTRTRHGTYRPYLLWLSIPFAVCGVVAFSSPELTGTAKVLFALISYALLMTVYTAINIPYSALGGVLTEDPQERLSVQSYRFMFAMLGNLLQAFFLFRLVDWLGGGDQQQGFQFAMLVLCAVAVLMFLACFALTRERVKPSQEAAGWRTIFSDLLRLFKNDQWVVVAAIAVLLLVLVGIRVGVTGHYVKYYLNGDGTMIANYFTIGTIGALGGALATNYLDRYLKKKQIFLLGSCGMIIFHVLLYLAPADPIMLTFTVHALANFFQIMVVVLMFAMVVDTVDYGELKLGRRMMAMTFAGHLLAVKLGFAIGGAMVGLVLDLSGYVPDTVQSESAMSAIRACFGLVPIACSVLLLLVYGFYRLTEDEMQSIRQRLQPAGDGAVAYAT